MHRAQRAQADHVCHENRERGKNNQPVPVPLVSKTACEKSQAVGPGSAGIGSREDSRCCSPRSTSSSSLRFVSYLYTLLAAIEYVEADLRFNSKLPLKQKISVHLVLVEEQPQHWSD